jgi:hypothetical protein
MDGFFVNKIGTSKNDQSKREKINFLTYVEVHIFKYLFLGKKLVRRSF